MPTHRPARCIASTHSRAFDADLDRLFEQHVLACRGTTLHQIEMRGGRRQHDGDIDRPVRKDAIQRVGDEKIRVRLCKSLATICAGCVAGCNLDAVSKIPKAREVRFVRHTEPDKRHAMLRRHHALPAFHDVVSAETILRHLSSHVNTRRFKPRLLWEP